jgi:hypothetical protein
MNPSSEPAPPIIILGAGYAGRVIHALGIHQGLPMLPTSRCPERHLAYIPPAHRLTFDLHDPGTWANVPKACRFIWCFPAAPEEAVRSFAARCFEEETRIVVLGSTSAYDLSSAANADPFVDESWPIELSIPRVCGEEYLRQHHRAIILRVAGMYGPGRNVLDWIRTGKVAASRRHVNLIHVHDLAAICLLALKRGRTGETYNVSDGTPLEWAEICAVAHRRWDVPYAEAADDRRPGKRLSTAKLRGDFRYTFRYPDLFEALDVLESSKREQRS